MKRTYVLNILVIFQLAALLMVQVNTVAPRIAQLYPALAVGDFSECHCSSGCACSSESRISGRCCCKQAKKQKLKMHCTTKSAKTGELSLRKCPCGSSSHIGFTSPEHPVFLTYTVDRPLPAFEGHTLVAPEMPSPHDNLSEPPIPPPRLNHAGGHVRV